MPVILILEYRPSSCSGGAEQSTRSLCEELERAGHKVHLAYREPGDYLDSGSVGVYDELIQIKLPVLTASTMASWIHDVLRLRKFCLKYEVNFVFTHVIHAAPMLRVLASICRVKTGMMLKWRLTTDSAGRKVKWGMAGIDRHVAVSQYTLDFWRRNGVKKSASTVVPEGFKAPSCREFSRRNTQKLNIVFAARIIPQKGLSVLLRSIRALVDRNVQLKLIVAGTFRGCSASKPDPYHCEVESAVSDLELVKHVEFVGFVSPVECLFAESDLVVAPSIFPEAHPLAVMGSMGMGTPVVATDIGGTKGIFGECFGEFLVPANNEIALTNAILRFYLLDHVERESIGKEMKDHVLQRFPFSELLNETSRGLGIPNLEMR